MEKRTKEELLARLTEAKAEITALNEQYEGQYLDPESDDGRKWNDLNSEVDTTEKTVAQLVTREQRVAELAKDPKSTDAGFLTARSGAVRGADIYDLSTVRSSLASPHAARAELHDRAKRAIEAMRFPHDRANAEDCQAAVERVLANVDDMHGSFARRILVTSNPTYKEAFGRWVASGGSKFSAAMELGTDDAGGFAVPVELDPTILPTSDGSVNPYRRIGRVEQITGKTWEGVSSAGVTAHRRAESGEADDDTPTLAQPTATPTRVDVFIPFSIELQASWGGMQSSLARMIQDAKDQEEATSFTTGNGTPPNPQGLLTGATITVPTAGTATFASPDLDSVEEALGSRFQSRAQWIGNRTIYNLVRHFDSNNGPDLWVRVADALQQGGNTGRTLLGYAANECSEMPSAHTSNSKILVLGDFSYLLIVDRIGLNMELVPHLFGENGRPTGQRGFYAYWNNTCKVLDASAFRVLKAL